MTGGYDHYARLLDVEAGQTLHTFQDHQSSVTHALFNPMGNLVVTGSKDSTVKIWDIHSGVCLNTFTQLLGEVSSLAFSQDGFRLLSG